jgi:hypothetical protein
VVVLDNCHRDVAEAYNRRHSGCQTLANGREMLQFRGAYGGTITRGVMYGEPRMRMKKGDERVIEEEKSEKQAGKSLERESVSAGLISSRLK